MDTTQVIFDGLREKVKTLILCCKEKDGKLAELEEKLNHQINLVTNLENKLKEKEKENMAIRLVQGFDNDTQKKDTVRKINEMVREIDKCIAYLNK